MKNYYKILDIEFGSDIGIVKKAYRQLAFKFHPDINKSPDAAQKFIEITEAYEVLRNLNRKLEYDRLFKDYLKSNIEIVQTESLNNFEFKQKEWAENARKKANEYSSLSYQEFTKRLLRELNIGKDYIPNVIAMILVSFLALSFFSFMPDAFAKMGGFGLIILLFPLSLCYLVYRLYLIAKLDYLEDRKRKFN